MNFTNCRDRDRQSTVPVFFLLIRVPWCAFDIDYWHGLHFSGVTEPNHFRWRQFEHVAHKKLWNSVQWLTSNLSLDEFIIAFGRYRRFMCASNPPRLLELDIHSAHIVETARIWPTKFYKYHKVFQLNVQLSCCSTTLQATGLRVILSCVSGFVLKQ